LVSAAVEIVRRVPDVRFTIVGDGPHRDTVLRQARDLGVADHFEFLGQRDDIPALLSAADLFVLPSRSEGLPNAVLEAMGSGLPIVATRVGGIVELIDDGRTGRLVPPDDAAALSSALLELIAHPERAAAFGKAGRIEAEARYSLQAMVSGFEQLYFAEMRARAGAAFASVPHTAIERPHG
jgi:glycosyltransferase involved in cell wall biosynthesis